MVETNARDVVEDLVISEADVDRLIVKYIRHHRYYPGRHEACAVDERGGGPSVWRFIPQLHIETVDAVADSYDLPRDSVVAAIAFYRRHRKAVDTKLLHESEADADPETSDGFEW